MNSSSPFAAEAYLFQVVRGFVFAALLLRFYSRHRWSGVLHWSWSWWADGVAALFAGVGFSLAASLGADHPLALTVGIIGRVAGYWQMAWLLSGTCAMATGKSPSRLPMRVVLLALFAIGLLLSLPLVGDAGRRLLLRSFFRSGALSLVLIGVGTVLLFRSRRTRLLGPSIMGGSLVLNGLEQVHFLALSVASAIGWTAGVHAVHTGSLGLLRQVEFVLQMATGAGMIVWLLEHERQALEASQEALRRSERRFRALVQNSSDAILLLGAGGELLGSARPEGRVLGYEAEGELGRSVAEFVHPEDQADLASRFGQSRGRPAEGIPFSVRARAADGLWRYVEGVFTNLLDDPDVAAILANYRDVTERVTSEAALRKSEQRYELAARATNDAIWDWDPATNVTVWNRGLESLFGYPAAEARRLGEWWGERAHPEDRPRIVAAYRSLLAGTEQTLTQEFRFQKADGSYASVLDRAWVARDEGGKAVRVIGALTDITVHKEAEAALRESELRYRLLFEVSPRAMCVYDAETLRFLAVNDAAVEQYGYSREDFRSMTIRDVFAPEELPRLETQLATMEPYMMYPDSWRQLRKDGTPIEVEVASHVAEFAGRRARVVNAIDVTQRKRAEADRARLQDALAAAAEEWKGTFDAVDVALLLLDPEGRIARLNRGAADLLGRDYAEALGRPLEELGPGEPWSTAALLTHHPLRAGTTVSEIARDPRSGHAWSVSASRFSTPEMAEERTVVLARDITAVVRLEESLRREETMSAMGSLVAGVAHEVRNPLFGISSTLDAFEARFGRTESYRRYFRVLRGEVERLGDLMRDLLDFGKPPVLELSTGPLAEVVRTALRSCQPGAQRARVRIEAVVPEGLPHVPRDPRRLAQVFQNLVENAVQHSREGQTVGVEARADQQGFVECAVRDRGPGFNPEDLARIFEPFFTRRRGGTGLGLSIVQRIVEQHGGTISAVNHPESGALVTVRLPQAAGPAAEKEVPWHATAS